MLVKSKCVVDLIHCTDCRSPDTQWVKRWPADLAVPSSSPARGEIITTIYKVQLTQPFIINFSSS